MVLIDRLMRCMHDEMPDEMHACAEMLSAASVTVTQAELGMNSVERMTEYLNYEDEAPAIIPENRCACPAVSSVGALLKSNAGLLQKTIPFA
jgi:hypothetical protein